MARSVQLQIAERARALIADERHWCRGKLARDINGHGVSPISTSAVKWCALGAVVAATHELTNDSDAAYTLAFKALRPHYSTTTLILINDIRGHSAALSVFDGVIAAAKL